jgi:hypothetical protein
MQLGCDPEFLNHTWFFLMAAINFSLSMTKVTTNAKFTRLGLQT